MGRRRRSMFAEGERESLLAADDRTNSPKRDTGPAFTEYKFSGKLTMFPLTVIFLAVGFAAFLRYGVETYKTGIFTSTDFYIGITMVAVFIVALVFGVIFLKYIVTALEFSVDPEEFTILKKGVYKRSKYVFSTRDSSLYYYRTHFTENKAWLTLVVRELDTFYLIVSWKGTGSQRARFFELLLEVHNILVKCKNRPNSVSTRKNLIPREIISREEYTIMNPFSDRLSSKGVVHSSRFGKATTGPMRPFSGASSALPGFPVASVDNETGPSFLCLEDLNVISYTDFFDHFTRQKLTAGGETSGVHDDEDLVD